MRKTDKRRGIKVLGVTAPARQGWSPYVRGASGNTRPGNTATYTLDGTEHLFNGKCHPDCPNLR